MSAVVPEMDPTRPAQADPRKILHAIESFGVTNMFASPALLHRLANHGAEHGTKLTTLRRAISAGAPASPPVLARFQKMLPDGVEVHTPYGATESLPVTSIGSAEILGETAAATARGRGVCVGRPVRNMSVAIIPIRDDAIASWAETETLGPGSIGEITVTGPVVTREYDNRPESTALAKIPDATGTIHHRMGDVGYLDESGHLWFCGRKAHRVETPDGTLFTAACEGLFNAHEDVYRSALVGVSGEPVLCVEIEKDRTVNEDAVREELLARGKTETHTARIQTILFHPAFPVDIRHNAKIFREKLAVWAARQLR